MRREDSAGVFSCEHGGGNASRRAFLLFRGGRSEPESQGVGEPHLR